MPNSPQSMPQRNDPRGGTAIILAMLCCLALVPMLGLAVDGANVYLMRNQISTALNAAVLAGARSLSVGQDLASQTANAQLIATNTFNANISGMNPNVTTTLATFQVGPGTLPGSRAVSGSVTANLPLMLMGLLRFTSTQINVTATAQRRNVNVILILDHSGAMNDASGFLAMQTDATAFVNQFSNGSDYVGMVTFATGAYLANPPSQNFQASVLANINSLVADSSGSTNTAAALELAYQQLRALAQPGALNVILLFTGANPGAFTGSDFFPYLTSTSPCNPASGPLPGVIWTTQNQGVGALADPAVNSLNDQNENRGPMGCSFDSTNPGRFLNRMASSDVNGFSSAGTYAPVDLTSFDYNDITSASENVLDNVASSIHSDTNLAPVIYVIGLGGNPWNPPDPVLMPRIANDPASSSFNSSAPAGQFIYAPTASQLQSAFNNIASQVLHLAAN